MSCIQCSDFDYIGLVGEESSKLQSLKFNLTTIEAATNKFSPNNTIGRGGFGDVYKVDYILLCCLLDYRIPSS